MSVEIRVPALGESIVEATVAAWRKQEGDRVSQGDVLVELETDKVNQEIFAEQSGVLQQIVKQEGETVGIGDVLAVIAEGAADGAAAAQPAPSAAAGERVSAQAEAAPGKPETPVEPDLAPSEAGTATPLARRIAAEHNIDLTRVRPEHGRVTKEDVLGYLEQHAASPAPQAVETAPGGVPPPGPPARTPSAPSAPALAGAVPTPAAPRGREERVRMSRRRQTIAQRLVQTQNNAAMLTTFNEVDMSAIMEVRKRRKDSFKERHGVSLGFMSFFTKAVVGSLKAFPRLNAEIQGDEMLLKYYYDIGIAVGAEEGLVVPVVRDADCKSFAEIEREIADLAKRARENTLTLSDLQGGTFTITNGGVFGSLMSTPILNGPQVGILGMHKIEERPIAFNGQVVIRPMMYLAVSYDHRIVDGREAVQFLVRIKELLEDPETLLLEG
ncbi:MAG TPA: 2-oxoglutarate dehydrogenase complex dihydrolipoyllysine-residue succinyltransferase [Ktedonobacterales bacterium]|jgi:2-oxoglutarate dehydrogenase E2 component (dihydrolipoamide succinyltransferase)